MVRVRRFHRSLRQLDRRSTSRGVTLLLFLILIALVSGGVALHFIHPSNTGLDRQDAVSESLAIARDALIGYAAVAGRPGELPCPDRDNDGVEDAPCDSAADRIGRIPWITLGIEDVWRNQGPGGPNDNSGETLWYAVSSAFRPGVAPPMNADSIGELEVSHVSGPLLTNVVAVVIAPGPALPGQSRDQASQNTAANYLEGENANMNATFETNLVSSTFNDVVRPITQDALMRAVTARVAREVSVALQAYFYTSGISYFPRARDYGNPDCDPSLTQGQLPMPGYMDTCTSYADWPSGILPTWLESDEWDRFIHYAVTPECSDPSATPCTATSGSIAVTGMNGSVPAVVIVTGRAIGSQSRPCVTAADCLEAPENIDGDSTFVRSGANSNDRLEIVPVP